MNGAAAPFSAHQDVLDAPIPADDAAARARLLDECKNRGRGAVQAKAWPDAAKLYRKALECCTSSSDNDKQTSAILNSNLSLVEGKMNGWDAALTAAQQAVTDDPTYTKAWWRLGQAKAALQDCDGAVEAIQRALQIDPTNKALLKELDKMKKAQQQKAAAAAAAKNDAASTGTTTTTTTTSTAVPSTKSSKGTTSTTTSKTKSAATTVAAAADDGTFTKSDHVKGYKIVNGKKTSYFHNELSAEAAQLIGDIAPKKIDTAAAAAGGGTSNSKNDTTDEKGTTSAWNKAGTWEEKDVTSWAKDALAKQIQEHATFTLPDSSPAAGAVASVTKCTCVGHASVAAVQGKKRYIYEFSVTVHWKFVTADGTADEAAGTLQFPDVDGTCAVGDPYDASNFVVKSADDPSMRPVLEAFVHKQGLRDSLHVAIDDWVRLFRETY